MNDSKPQVVDRILAYVEQEKLSGEEVDRALVEFLEYRNKRVYLYQTDPDRLRRLDLTRFTRRIEAWSRASIVLEPSSPRENYSYIDANSVRVTFSETHRVASVDLLAERVSWKDVGRVIVLDADRRTGFVTLSFDPPGKIHPRGTKPLDYFGYYRARAEALLGTWLEPYDLQPALQRLEKTDLIEIPQGRGSGLDGAFDMIASGTDIRHMAAFSMREKLIAVRDNGRYIWVPQPPALLRKVTTTIDAGTSVLRFTKDSLVHEVRHVLEQIQAHS